MIPIVMARHIQSGLADYLETTFPMTNKPFQGSMRALSHQSGALTLDPFVSVKLPFRTAPDDEAFPFSECLHPAYRPYAHQMRAFKRIAAGESTLVATGTGSGKTECFLYPILAHCHRQRSRYQTPGIKAILVYPMNALAADQAKRLASLIHDSPELNGNITAGMYVGNASLGANSSSKRMTEDSIITDHDELLKNPPDILLTNYKMLDYLLVRPEDSRLWDHNDEDTLRYFVVDELHTFDGAQGTDLACLLRRLTDRLHADSSKICFIGTSATMGTDDSKAAVCQYASEIFHTEFDPEHSVITENRISSEEFFAGNDTDLLEYDSTIPDRKQADELIRLESDVEPDIYLKNAAQAWLNAPDDADLDSMQARIALGQQLRRSRFLASLTALLSLQPQRIGTDLLNRLSTQYVRFSQLDARQQQAAVDALIALVSYARTGNADHPRPFLDVQVQLWSKELRQLTANIVPADGTVQFKPALELDKTISEQYLPVINCRDCGGTAWIGFTGKDGRVTAADRKAFYNAYFSFQPNNQFLILQPYIKSDQEQLNDVPAAWFCPQCMRGSTMESDDGSECACPECGSQRVPVRERVLELVAPNRRHYRCPFCASERGLALVGLRSTTQIGVMLSQLFADAYNDDDKTIVFSDSVQDASFRASALSDHTWRFALRNSAMDYIQHDDKDNATFAQFLDHQNDYYRRQYTNDAEYVVRFIAPNMTWMREYESVLAGNPGGPERRRLIEWIGRRLRLESLFEFGLRSRVGRTLEKSGCATLYFDQQKLNQTAMRFRERCINEIGVDDAVIHSEDWVRLIVGLLDLIRSKGAFFDISYERYLAVDANRFFLQYGKKTGNWWSPGSYFDVLPRFLADTPQGAHKDSYDTLGSIEYVRMANRYIADNALVGDIAHELLSRALDTCVDAGFIAKREFAGKFGTKHVYGLNENECRISTDVSQLVCSVCGRNYSCATQNLQVWEGSRCITRQCPGRLHLNTDATAALELSYYGKLYRSKPAERIRAAEHTSLLDGDDRTKLEKQFKGSEHTPGEVNVLTCTPTLEMGIDIGDLSTVILASMPPSQARYIQRAGRAGRRDGNSLVLTVANSKPHDMYFYQHPLDMIGGDVTPPHIFLHATAVLERQLIAYALDTWVHEKLVHGENPSEIIPTKLRSCLDNVREEQRNAFPFTFLDYVQSHAMLLLDRFCELFEFEESAEDGALRELLEQFLLGTNEHDADSGQHSLPLRIYRVFQKTNAHIAELIRQKHQIESIITDLDSKPDDSAYQQQKNECRSEIRGIDKIINNLNDQNTFNFLSDQGILPNYAFPESGVTLHTILKEDRIPTEDGKGEDLSPRQDGEKTHDFTRPAASAITELAPGNTFYAAGRKYVINRILFAKGDMDEDTVMWKLCPNCSHAEPVSSVRNTASCPSCGSAQWADVGQERPMVRIDTVISEERYSDSVVDGSNEDRSSMLFVKNSLIDIERNDVESAWKIDHGDTDFAYEYVPHGTVREINFGKADTDGREMTVAGEKRIRNGFNVCVRCGTLADDKGYINHSYFCPNRTNILSDEKPSKCLFLFREIHTEMLRILVPGIADASGDSSMAKSFTAAVMLGMSRIFGNVAHLAMTLSNEPLRDGSGLRKIYLVIYDTVPGGTGYLKQIADNGDRLIDVLQQAYEAMNHCDCDDGCYRCLYSYRQNRDLDSISKKTALAMIEPILGNKDLFVRTTTVSDVSVNKLLDSKLEAQFLEALRRLYANPLAKGADERGRRAVVTQAYIDRAGHHDGYLMIIGDSQWEIELQQDVSRLDNVPAVLSKPDFRLHCVSDDQPVNGANGVAKRRKDVLVFTDGLQFHAGIVAEDTAKREALRRCGYRVWSLTYDDVVGFLETPDDKRLLDPALNVSDMPGKKAYKMSVESSAELDPGQLPALSLLGYYLSNPDAEQVLSSQAEGLGVAMIDRPDMTQGTAKANTMAALENALIGTNTDYMARDVFDFHHAQRLNMYVGISLEDDHKTVSNQYDLLFDDTINGVDLDGDNPLTTLDDEERQSFKREWASFWHVANIMQFADAFRFGTISAVASKTVYAPLCQDAVNKRASENEKEQIGEDWYRILRDDVLEAQDRHAAESFIRAGIPAPDRLPGDDVEESADVFIPVTFAWTDKRIIFLVPNSYCEDPKAMFSSSEWNIMTNEEEVLRAFSNKQEGN